MFEYADSEVISLERLSFAGVTLDSNLQRGQWRPLTEKEEEILKSNAI
jgi:16S rRNA U516 pseudouridylate synthase RsuA-like enzyme